MEMEHFYGNAQWSVKKKKKERNCKKNRSVKQGV